MHRTRCDGLHNARLVWQAGRRIFSELADPAVSLRGDPLELAVRVQHDYPRRVILGYCVIDLRHQHRAAEAFGDERRRPGEKGDFGVVEVRPGVA